VVQRVSRAQVRVDGAVVGELDQPGLCVFVAVTHSDDEATARALADKLYNLRILAGDRSCADTGSPLLIVSQFTLYGDTRRGRRPSWSAAAPPEQAEPLVSAVLAALRDAGATVAAGRFRAAMEVDLVNDGPVTVILDVPPGPQVAG
jgi:D-tyrosyl-tRNA(Tyr) deacylase